MSRASKNRETPVPDTPDKHAWHRRFTTLVDKGIASNDASVPMTPKLAGEQAKYQVRVEFAAKFPGQEMPPWMP